MNKEEYFKNEGRFDEKSFEMAKDLVDKARNVSGIVDYGPSFSQAKNMAKSCDLEITNEQINAYIFLREDNNLRGVDGDLCDQEIFDGMLDLTGDEKNRKIFRDKNPVIFGGV